MLSVHDLSVWFHTTGETYAVRNVSFDLHAQEHMVMIGETGSGKSVLMQAILKLLPETAHCSGKVALDGVDLMELSAKEMTHVRGARIGYVPQGGGNALNPLLRIGFQVSEGAMEHSGLKKREAIRRIIPLLKRFQLGDEEKLIQTYPHMLSGGMRQRVLIAMGMAADPQVIFADEPTKGLDEARIDQVVRAFEQLHDQAILCVTHDLDFARAIADTVIVMYAAVQLEVSDSMSFFRDALHPYSQALIASQAENGFACELGFAPPKDQIIHGGCVFRSLCPYVSQKCRREPPMFAYKGRKVRCWRYEGRDSGAE